MMLALNSSIYSGLFLRGAVVPGMLRWELLSYSSDRPSGRLILSDLAVLFPLMIRYLT